MKKSTFYSPTPAEWKHLRLAFGLTQAQAADLVCSSLRTIQSWEGGSRKIPPMAWELFKLKLGVEKEE